MQWCSFFSCPTLLARLVQASIMKASPDNVVWSLLDAGKSQGVAFFALQLLAAVKRLPISMII